MQVGRSAAGARPFPGRRSPWLCGGGAVYTSAVSDNRQRAAEIYDAITDHHDPETVIAAALDAAEERGRAGSRVHMAAVLRAAAAEQRAEAGNVPDTDEGTHADGHRCAADFLDRRAARMGTR